MHALACPGAEVAGGPDHAQLSNFTLAEPSLAQAALLHKVRTLRRAEQAVARWELDGQPRPPSTAAGFEVPASFGAAIGTTVAPEAVMTTKEAKAEDGKKRGKKDNAKEEGAEDGEAEGEGESAGGEATEGERVEAGLFYRYFELHPQWRKATQAVLHGEQVGTIKASFNMQFQARTAHGTYVICTYHAECTCYVGAVNVPCKCARSQAVLALKRAEIERVVEKKMRVAEVPPHAPRGRMERGGGGEGGGGGFLWPPKTRASSGRGCSTHSLRSSAPAAQTPAAAYEAAARLCQQRTVFGAYTHTPRWSRSSRSCVCVRRNSRIHMMPLGCTLRRSPTRCCTLPTARSRHRSM